MSDLERKAIFRTVGRVAQDPERRKAGDKDLVRFGLAVDQFIADKDDPAGRGTVFFDVNVWAEGLQGPVLDLIRKGQVIAVEGGYSEYAGTTLRRQISAWSIGKVDFMRRTGAKPAPRTADSVMEF